MQGNSKARRALFLINRRSRQGQEQAPLVGERLRKLGLDLIDADPSDAQSLARLIKQHAEEVDLIILGGGDGTLNGAANALVDAKRPVGLLPLGTANDLARTLGIPTDLDAACEVIATGRPRQIDLGCVNDKCFFNVASLGLSVEISQSLSKQVKGRWGVLAYALTAFKVIWRAHRFRARIQSETETVDVHSFQIAVGNGRHYGGGLTVAADADIDDGFLDLYSLEVKKWWEMFWLLPALMHGEMQGWNKVRTMKGTEFRVSTPKRLPINTDGEMTSHTPAHFRLLPKALTILVPNDPPPP